MSQRIERIKPGPGQESVWDYPRPPRVEPTDRLIQVIFNGETLAETRRALRVLETSHPPVYYLPPQDVRMSALTPTPRRTICEFKGAASYWTVRVGERAAENAAWSYADPAPGYEALRGYLAFYASKMDACTVDGERVTPQEGDFFGGWITADVLGPLRVGRARWPGEGGRVTRRKPHPITAFTACFIGRVLAQERPS